MNNQMSAAHRLRPLLAPWQNLFGHSGTTLRLRTFFLRQFVIVRRLLIFAGFSLASSSYPQTPDFFNPNANSSVLALAEQIDGKIPVAGKFTVLGGQTRNLIGRLDTNGVPDSLNPGATFGSPQVNGLAIQPDGKILVGGSFNYLGGRARNCIGRLNPDGTVDPAFAGIQGGSTLGVTAIGIQSDGKVIAAGGITFTAGIRLTNVARFNPDGTFDTNFTVAVNGVIRCATWQPDDKFIVGGDFSAIAGQPRSCLARLNADGTLDASFDAGTNSPATIFCLGVQPDGKILVVGSFANLDGQPCGRIGRLNADGSLDTTFNASANGANVPGSGVFTLALQTDGKIIVGGAFTKLGTLNCTNIGRLNADGTADATFNPGMNATNSAVYSLAIQADGKVLVGGYFTNLAGQARQSLGRLNNPTAPTEDLSFDGSTITWLRGGGAPEVWRTTFETSPDGTNWTNVGSGVRIAGGWQLAGLSLPKTASIRARGFVCGGGNASSWFVESRLSASPPTSPVILVNDTSFGFRTNQFGFHFTTGPGQTTVIEGSTNLSSWQSLATNSSGSSPLYFVDPESSSFPYRFYRVRVQ
jgi:uncharacterized delta-60 repeat protein